jgi:hypothetical protein
MRLKIGLLFGIVILAAPLFAHHSFAAEYDANKPITLKGVVTKFEWMNPHSRLYLDVTDDAGKVTSWEMEAGNPTQLQRMGWRRDVLKPGDVITVSGYRAKDGSNVGAASKITTAEGRELLAGSAGERERDSSPRP